MSDRDKKIKRDVERLIRKALVEAERADKAANGRRSSATLSELVKKLGLRWPPKRNSI